MRLDRRTFLRTGCCAGATLATGSVFANAAKSPPHTPSFPVVDAHIHLFDPGRPGGVPWPEPGDPIYPPALPGRYQQLAESSGVVGAIAIEASPLPRDNDWLLDVAAKSDMIVGVIGDLIPSSPTFSRELRRLQQNPLFLGIRFGNLWKYDLAVDRRAPAFQAGIRLLADARLVFETANPNSALLQAILAIAQEFPDLTIVIDHLPHAEEPDDVTDRKSFWASITELGKLPRVYTKLSEIINAPCGTLRNATEVCRDKLDRIWDAFGSGKLIYGSDWPNSDHVVSYQENLRCCPGLCENEGP